ncbi:MAG: T9SS type A sorting domain-containing protein, partial [Flavobacteriales bacterium]|nr:T9SS type A sorting domain-containing protein [Flavobacteriales bacterium]
ELTSCLTVTVDFNTGLDPEASTGSEAWYTVQPNPSSGLFQLIPAADVSPLTITVYDAVGCAVYAPFVAVGKRATTLDLSTAAPGAYYLVATSQGEQRISRIMVQR